MRKYEDKSTDALFKIIASINTPKNPITKDKSITRRSDKK